jgi:hypothetical protein
MTRAALLAVTLLATSTPAAAQRLRRASEAVHTGRSSGPRASNDNDPCPRPGVVTARARGDGWRWTRRYVAHPYAEGARGVDLDAGSAQRGRDTAAALTLEGGLALPNIGRAGLSVRAMFGAVEIELRGAAMVEPSQEGAFWVGVTNVRGALALTEGGAARVRAFLGFTSWLDAAGSATGPELGVGADVFPGAPWVLSGELSGAVLGGAGVIDGRVSVGVLFGRTELQLGWSHRVVYPFEAGDAVDLGGPSLGLRAWL